ncbi:metal-dependent transcriptional regulator, partial [Rhodococcus hoagii]|nr:metal-dependent transcriptional regulator [Prescottella equi]
HFEADDKVTIKRVRDRTELLIYLSSKDILIDEEIKIINKDDTNKVIIVQKDENVTILSYDNAAYLR